MSSTVSSTVLNFGLISCPVSVKKCSGKKGTEINSATADGHKAGHVYADKDAIETIVGTALVNGELPDPVKLAETLLPFELGDKGKPIQRPRKGVFLGGEFTEIPAESLTAIDDECKLPDLTIDGFVPIDQVPFERATGAYYLAPASKSGVAGAKPLGVLRDGLKLRGVAGFGRFTLRTLSYPFVVYEKNGGILLNTLEYATNFAQSAEAAECLNGVQTDEKTLALAGTLIDQLTVDPVNLDGLADDRFEKREELIAKAIAGEAIEVTEKPAEVVTTTADLADLLAASIGAAAPAPAKPKTARKKKVAA